MNALALGAALLAALCIPAFAQDAPAPQTTWVGQFRIGGKATAITLHDRSATKGAAQDTSESSAKLLDVARKASGNDDFTVVRLPNAGHGFIASSTGNNSEFPTSTHFAAGDRDKMQAWLRAHRFSRP